MPPGPPGGIGAQVLRDPADGGGPQTSGRTEMGLTIATLSTPKERTPQRISLCMIMRDEEEHLARCLASVQGVVDEIVIVDTGSVDRSIEIAESFGARVLHEEWHGDFATPRNTGIDAATGDWILVLDADEELIDGAALKELLHDEDIEGYLSLIHI